MGGKQSVRKSSRTLWESRSESDRTPNGSRHRSGRESPGTHPEPRNESGRTPSRSSESEAEPVQEPEVHVLSAEESSAVGISFEEIQIKKKRGSNDANCDLCLLKGPSVNTVITMCFTCELYLCAKCKDKHETHDVEHQFIDKDSRSILQKVFLDLKHETGRRNKIMKEHISVTDRIHMKHKLDSSDCLVSGICGLDDFKWVICDNGNKCLKIFNLRSNFIQRYIRLGSKPQDVTEVEIKRDVSLPDNREADKADDGLQRLLAVTFPMYRQIQLLDICQKPAARHSIIKTDKRCYNIAFCANKIFALCMVSKILKGVLCYVYIISTDGETLQVINVNTGMLFGKPGIAVVPRGIYLTDYKYQRLLFVDLTGKVVVRMRADISVPGALSIDDDGNLYMRAGSDENVYKISLDLKQKRPLLPKTKDGVKKKAESLCFYRNRILMGHSSFTGLQDHVSVVVVL